MKKIAFIVSSAPAKSDKITEMINLLLACASFDISPTIFFIDEGVYCLDKTNFISDKQKKNLLSLQSLKMFDINEIYSCSDSLKKNLNNQKLIIDTILFSSQELSNFLKNFDIILTF